MDPGDEWVVIGGKGKPKKHQQRASGIPATAAAAAAPPPLVPLAPPPPAALPGWAPEPAAALPAAPAAAPRGRRPRAARTEAERLAALAATVEDCRREVAGSPAFAAVRAAMAAAEAAAPGWRWSEVRSLVVYGLGCIEDSRVSRYQLAMALCIRDLLPGLSSPPQLFDPAFSETDAALLPLLGAGVIPVNEGGGRAVTEATFFYLPHCEAALCENLLAANWAPGQLPHIAVLGNSFASYRDRWTGAASRPGGVRPDRLLRLCETGAVSEFPTPDGRFHAASAFNDSSLHIFPQGPALAAALGG